MGFFFPSSPLLVFILLILLLLFCYKVCVHTCRPLHKHGSQRASSAVHSGSHVETESLAVHRCVLQANWPRGFQGFPCFLPPTLHRPAGISDVHCSIQLSADPGDFNSDAHVCMVCALPTRSFSHHQSVLFLLRQSKAQVSFLSPPYGGTGG